MSEEEKEPPPTSPPSRLSRRTKEEWCNGGWSFPRPTYAREEERCGGGWSFPPCGAMEEEQCGSSEKKTSCSGLGPASLWAPSAC
jgi:hypothetical protein